MATKANPGEENFDWNDQNTKYGKIVKNNADQAGKTAPLAEEFHNVAAGDKWFNTCADAEAWLKNSGKGMMAKMHWVIVAEIDDYASIKKAAAKMKK